MTVSLRQTADDVENLLDYMVMRGIVLYRRPLRVERGLISWLPNSRSIPFLPHRDHHSVQLYQHWLQNGHYSAIIFEGSLIQITFEYAGNVLIGHRLAYVPAPALVDPEMLEIFPIFDIIESALTDMSQLRFESSVRFEFDAAAAAPGHPASHFTFNSADCRVPCVTPMRLGMFIRFVLTNFYPDVWNAHPFFHGLQVSPSKRRTITADEASGLHLAWAT